jgi:WD40 repeat protein
MEDPDLLPPSDDSDPIPQIQTKVDGTGNQVNDKISGGNVFANVTGNVTINNYYGQEEPQTLIDDADKSAEAGSLPCPYRGLSNFELKDAEYFFGRKRFVEELVHATQTRKFIPLLGASGSGKSSVVLAGLVPKLQQAGDWQFTYFRPNADPFYALAEALVPLYRSELDSTDNITQAGKLSEDLKNGTTTLARVFSSIQRKHPNHRVLLIADQFEQLYTLCDDETIRHDFLDKLLTDIFSPTDKTPFAPVLVATMRADFFPTAILYPPFADVLQNANLILKSMNRSELTEIIETPSQMLGVTFEAGLVNRILDDVDKEPGILPLLEFALTELWKRRSNNQLTHAAYGEIGEVQGALDLRATQEYEKFSKVDQERVRRIFIQLVRPGEGAEDTRRVAMKGELGAESWSLVKQFADARLVVTSRNASGQETVEVVHEALIRNWGELRGWMEVDRVFRAWQERLRGAMLQWQETNQDEGSLLRGAALAEAEEQLRKRPEELVYESDFIEQSLQGQERIHQTEAAHRKREIWIARGIAGGSLMTTVVINMFGWVIWQQIRQAELNLVEGFSYSALSLIAQGKDLDAFIPAIRAGRILQNQQASNPSVLYALQEVLNHRSEHNRIKVHDISLWIMSLSPDVKNLATTDSEGKAIKLLNLDTGKEIYTLQGHKSLVNSITFSPDGKTLATGSEDKTIKLWDLDTGREIRTLQGHYGHVLSVKFNPDGKTLATGSEDKTIKLWNLDTGEEIRTLQGHKSRIRSIIFSPDGKTLATSSEDKTIKHWNLDTGKEISTLQGYKSHVRSITLSPDGKTLATSSEDKTIRLLNLDTGKEIHTLQGQHGHVLGVKFSPDGKTLIIGSSEKIKFWNVATGKEIHTLKTGERFFTSVSFSLDGKTLATRTNNEIMIWNLGIEKEIRSLQLPEESFRNAILSPDGKTLVTVSGDKNNIIKYWDLATGKEIRTLHVPQESFHPVEFSPDGKTLSIVDKDGKIKLWNLDASREIRVLQGHQRLVLNIEFSSDGKTITAVVCEASCIHKQIKLWNLETGMEIPTMMPQKSFRGAIFSPDGKTLVTVSGNKNNIIKYWSLVTGKEIPTLKVPKESVHVLRFSPDGKILAASNDDYKTIKLWNLDTGKEIRTLKVPKESVHVLRFSPDGKILAASNDDKTIKLWNLDTGKEIRTFQGHKKSVYIVIFSPDGKTLVTGSRDEIIFWNRETGWDLDALIGRSCDWVSLYILNNPEVSESDKHLCDGIGTKNSNEL